MLRRYSVTVLRRVCNCVTVLIMKRFYKDKGQNQNTKKALGKQEVSLGESGSFIRGKSEFPLGKVQRVEKG